MAFVRSAKVSRTVYDLTAVMHCKRHGRQEISGYVDRTAVMNTERRQDTRFFQTYNLACRFRQFLGHLHSTNIGDSQ